MGCMREYEDIRPEVYIPWPDRPWALSLTPHQAGMNWVHNNRGHDKVYKECLSCVCEEAY
jgi:hypothetical protein